MMHNTSVEINTFDSNYGEIIKSPRFEFVSDSGVESHFLLQSKGILYSGNNGKIETQQINEWISTPNFTQFPNDRLNADVHLAFKDNSNEKNPIC